MLQAAMAPEQLRLPARPSEATSWYQCEETGNVDAMVVDVLTHRNLQTGDASSAQGAGAGGETSHILLPHSGGARRKW